ncbi:MAG TPA: SDR family oxidoreductase [Tepidisphaeraceae bacterium]|jgi:NAD(P)-dependent dehydrogenase (short-subunit alcohol dehydrogenase family)
MDKIAVVTGAGSGVGRAVAIELTRQGWQVAALGRRPEMLDETAKLAGKDVIPMPCDISKPSEVDAMAGRVRAELGVPGAVVNSAGVNVPKRALADLSVDDYQHLVDVNLTGAFLCVHAFLPDMRQRGSGTFVHVISDAGLFANRVSGAAYIAAKFGLTGLSDTINAEERRNGIRSVAVFPGEINTPLLLKRPVIPTEDARLKMLQPEDVAACVLFGINLPERATVEQLLVRPRWL